MELLQGLLNRVSIQRLESPPPTKAQLEVMLQAALRAPDHANLKPWRSVMVAGEGLTELGAILLSPCHSVLHLSRCPAERCDLQ